MSVGRKGIDAVVEWVVKQVLDRWGLPILMGVIIPGILWFTGLVKGVYAVAGWAIAALGATLLALVGIVIVLGVRTSRLKTELGELQERLKHPSDLVRFDARGVRWFITDNFWAMYRSFDSRDASSLTAKTLLGPFCPNCEAEITDDLTSGRMRCGECSIELSPTIPIQAENKPGIISMNNSDPIWPIRRAAYGDAQRKALRGELRRQ